MSLHILKGGILSLLQDYGRYGYQHLGITHGGPMDEHAFLWANYLLGNHYNATQIEITMGMFEAEFTQPTRIALCGAEYVMTLNDTPLEPWQTYSLNTGDVLSVQHPVQGLRLYLAIEGGFEATQQLGSSATVIRESLGGLQTDGTKLQDGDSLAYPPQPEATTAPIRMVPKQFIPEYNSEITLRFIPNTSITGVNQATVDALCQQTFEISQRIDRMAYCLSGHSLPCDSQGIISQGVSAGAIQVPKDGQPIVLLKDRQTMGGYPLAGCVASLDLPLLAQSIPGVKVNFRPTSVAKLEAELVLHQQFFGINYSESPIIREK